MSETKVVWHKFPDEKPKIKENESRDYLITVSYYGRILVTKDYWLGGGRWYEYHKYDVLAWAELPEPYNRRNNNDERRLAPSES